MLQLKNVVKKYNTKAGEVNALDGVSFVGVADYQDFQKETGRVDSSFVNNPKRMVYLADRAFKDSPKGLSFALCFSGGQASFVRGIKNVGFFIYFINSLAFFAIWWYDKIR